MGEGQRSDIVYRVKNISDSAALFGTSPSSLRRLHPALGATFSQGEMGKITAERRSRPMIRMIRQQRSRTIKLLREHQPHQHVWQRQWTQ